MSETNNFDALIAEIDTLTKAMPQPGDASIAEAATEGASEGEDSEENPAADPEDGDMAKSFKLKLEDGTEIDAMDGAKLIKALSDRVERLEGDSSKAIGALTALVKSQGEVIGKLSARPVLRKSVLTVNERPAGAAAPSAQPQGVSGEEFMAKAMALNTAGKLTGLQVAIAEQHINAGQNPPADIVRAVLA